MEEDIEKLAEERAKELARKEASLIKYLIFLPCVAMGFVIAVTTQSDVLTLGVPVIGLILGYIAHYEVKESAYREHYEKELTLLRKRGNADER